MKHLFYLLGQPGAGKTSVMNELLTRYKTAEMLAPVPHNLLGLLIPQWENPVWLGRHRATFGGTDAMAMSIQPQVLRWMQADGAPQHLPGPPDLVMGEGDRLGNASFFHAARMYGGYQLHLYELVVPHNVAAARRAQRATEFRIDGQDPRWLKGRISKSHRVAVEFCATKLDGEQPVTMLAERIARDLLDLMVEERRVAPLPQHVR